MRLSPNEPMADRQVEGWGMRIAHCTLDSTVRGELLDVKNQVVVIEDCFIVKKDRFWRFVFLQAMRTAAFYLSFGALRVS